MPQASPRRRPPRTQPSANTPARACSLLASKFLPHQPLNRQSETYAYEGVEIDVSTVVDWGRCLRRGARSCADDTTVPVLAKMKTVTGRI